MVHFPGEEDTIFRNFLILFLHVFEGLEYLHGKGIVHGDVKGTLLLCMCSYMCLYVCMLILLCIVCTL